ncbi:MAG: cation transporter, partial [Polyangiales bacterium]
MAHSHDHAPEHPEHEHEHAHDHPSDAHADGAALHARDGQSASKLPWVLALTLIFFVVELVAAGYANSNALRADAI